MPECPICSSPVPDPKQDLNWSGFDCPRCGRWSCRAESSGVAWKLLREIGEKNPRGLQIRSRLSHILRAQQQHLPAGRWVELPLDNLGSWHLEEPLPSPSEQLDQLVIRVGERQPSPAESATLPAPETSAWICATITRPPSDASLGWLLEQERTAALIERRDQNGPLLLRLRMEGWLGEADFRLR